MRFHSALVTRLHSVSLAQRSHSSTLGAWRTQSSCDGFVSDRGAQLRSWQAQCKGVRAQGLGVYNTNEGR